MISALLRAVIDSISRWLVGSSKISTFAPSIIILDKRTLTFSPPDNTFTFLTPSSPGKSILPKKPLTYVGSGSGEKRVSHSTMVMSSVNWAPISLGKYATFVVTPHLYSPESASAFSVRMLKSADVAISFEPTKAILSVVLTIKDISFNAVSPSIVLLMPFTSSTSFPISLSGLKST